MAEKDVYFGHDCDWEQQIMIGWPGLSMLNAVSPLPITTAFRLRD